MGVRAVAVAVLLGVGLAVTGCTAAESETPELPPALPDAGCTSGHPDRLALVAQVPDEVQYLEQTVVCSTSALATATFENDTDVVLAFTLPVGASAQPFDSSVLGAVFRDGAVGDLVTTTFAAPGDSMWIETSSAMGLLDVEWHVDAQLTAAWLLQETLVERMQTQTQLAVTDVLAGDRIARRAVATCAFAGGNTTAAAADLSAGSVEFFDVFRVAAAAAPCAEAWRAAEVELGPQRWAPLVDGVAGAGQAVSEASALEQRISRISRWVSVAVAAAR